MSNEPFDPVRLAYEQSADVVHTNLSRAIRIIDEEFGNGYAKSNPALVSAFIQAATSYVNSTAISTALYTIAESIDGLTSGTIQSNKPVP